MLTPEIVESRRQESRKIRTEQMRRSSGESTVLSPDSLRRPAASKPVSAKEERLNECNAQRNSFASYRDRLKSSGARDEVSTKSESGANFRSSGLGNKVLNRISPRGGASPENISSSYRETQSDAGSTPAFLANVKLRKTPSSKRVPEQARDEVQLSYTTDTEPENDYGSPATMGGGPQQYRETNAREHEPEDQPTPPEKKLTYRERREIELQKEREEKAKQEALKPKEPPKRDVASLIRRRIAANKAKDDPKKGGGEESGANQVAQYRGMLKPTKKQGEIQEDLAAVPSYDTETATLYSTGSASPQRTPRSVSRTSPRKHVGVIEQQGPYHEESIGVDATSSPMYDQGKGGSAGVQPLVSPASVGSDMNYSTDNSTVDGSRHRASHSMHDVHSPRSSNDGHSAKPVHRALQKLKPDVVNSESAETPETTSTSHTSEQKLDEPEDDIKDVKSMLSNFLGGKSSAKVSASKEGTGSSLRPSSEQNPVEDVSTTAEAPMAPSEKQSDDAKPTEAPNGRPALKDDPKYERYFRMLKVGMPMEVVKHAMMKDGNDPSVMDGDHDKPVGLPLKDDPKYSKYFKMLRFGISMEQVKHAMERDGLMPEVMDQDHNLPAISCERRSQNEPKEKPTHRRARLHWKTLQKVRSNSLWAKIEEDQIANDIDIDEQEFNELFQADLTPAISPRGLGANRKRGAAVRVIDAKRANNGGIILARLKMTHDDMADAVDRM